MPLKKRLRDLGLGRFLLIWAASIALSVVGANLVAAWRPLADSPWTRFLLEALEVTTRMLPTAVVGMAAGVGAFKLRRDHRT